jgi:hypothetical protein
MEPVVEWDVAVIAGINTDYVIRGCALPGPGMSLSGGTFLEAPVANCTRSWRGDEPDSH